MAVSTAIEEFLQACGTPGALRLEVEGPGASKADVRAIRQPFVVVGRDEGVDLQLDHPAVGRRHAYLQVIEGRLFCMDMQSRTGTVWPNGPKTMGWVRPNRPISIGPYRIRFQGGEGPSRDVPDGAGRGVETAGADHEDVLEIDGPGRGVTIWRMRRPIVVLGRGRPSWVLLPHEDVSRIHCSIIRTENELWVVDLLGRDGITVNHRQVRFSRVTPDDMVGIGPYRIRMLAPAVPGRVVTIPGHVVAIPGHVVAGPLGAPRHPMSHSTILPMGPPPQHPAAPAETSVAGLAPLFQEISQMQQQMADQFQQALMMMFQLFSTMHQDQMGLIREELTQIRKLAMEQQAIQAELVRQQQQQQRAAPGSVESGGGGGIVLPDRAIPPPAPAPRGAGPGPGRSGAGGRPAGFDAGLGAGAGVPPGADGGSGAGVEVGPRPADTGAGESASSASPWQGPAYPDQDGLHLMLSQRLAAIQEERQSRWQKLLDTVMGKSAPPAAP